MRFLLSRGAQTDDPGRVLIVQTCNPNLLEYVIVDARKRWPGADLSVLLQRGMREHVRLPQGVRGLDNPAGGHGQFARELRSERFDLIAFSGVRDPGYWKLRLLPFYLNPPRIALYDRHARPADLGLAGLLATLLGSVGPTGGPKRLLRRLLAPLIAGGLLLYLWYERARRAR
ncbi:MAG: hypothetical protein P9M14_11430 [Candidatus Alcyoniella australis]|nr:hypothetical protein [Candidatus Alcyoniella australis]